MASRTLDAVGLGMWGVMDSILPSLERWMSFCWAGLWPGARIRQPEMIQSGSDTWGELPSILVVDLCSRFGNSNILSMAVFGDFLRVTMTQPWLERGGFPGITGL